MTPCASNALLKTVMVCSEFDSRFCSLFEIVLSHVNFLPLKCILNIWKTYKRREEERERRNWIAIESKLLSLIHIFHRDKLFSSLFFVFQIPVSRTLKTHRVCVCFSLSLLHRQLLYLHQRFNGVYVWMCLWVCVSISNAQTHTDTHMTYDSTIFFDRTNVFGLYLPGTKWEQEEKWTFEKGISLIQSINFDTYTHMLSLCLNNTHNSSQMLYFSSAHQRKKESLYGKKAETRWKEIWSKSW